MSQILKSLQLSTTGSAPGTPNSDFGVVYASGSNKFFFKNAAGTEFDLTATNGLINTLYYTGSAIGNGTTQTYTWNKPVGLKYIEVCCVGAGGGGGGGMRSTNSSTVGGAGGGGGAIVWLTLDANTLTNASYTIVVGAGGAGGGGSTTSTGNTGITGGTSSFGTLVIARGGAGGVAGGFAISSQTSGGQALLCTPAGYPYSINGCNAGTLDANAIGPSYASPAFVIFDNAALTLDEGRTGGGVLTNIPKGRGGGGGGYGGGLQGGIHSGSRGSNGYQFTTLITNGGFPGSGSSGQNATTPTDNMITTLLQFSGSTTTYGLGGGGHGGGYGSSGNGGNGSNGGLYGAAGGGGGHCGTGSAAFRGGNGGSGSSGLCIITEFY